ncbi:MAG: hypothetical protein PHY64_06730 [Eubacteriales bacterium]|nr:hypothetical protein [Eubacteriales bacterium]
MNHVTLMEEGVMRLNDFNLYVFTGEILGLLLLNDRGLSAFLRLLQHNIPLHYGAVYFEGKLVNSYGDPVDTLNPTQIIERRSHLIANLTLAENIFVLNRNFADRMIQNKKLNSRAALVAEDLNITVDLESPVEKLSTYQRMEIELMRAVVSGTGLVVLRDLVHLLTTEELEALHQLIRKCAKMGISFLYICDQAETMEEVCGRVALYQDGSIRKVIPIDSEKAKEQLSQYVASFFDIEQPMSQEKAPDGADAFQTVLSLSNCTDDVLNDVSLQARRGKVTLFADQRMEVLERLSEVVQGRKRLAEGRLVATGRFGEACIVYEIHQNPTRSMLFYNLSVMDNLCFHLDDRLSKVWKPKRIRKSARKELQARLKELLYAKNLNGLNKSQLYDIVYSKCLLEKPDLAILMCPVDNTDMDLRRNVLEHIRILSENEIAVLILSTDFSLSASPLIEQAYRMETPVPAEQSIWPPTAYR